MKQWWYSDGTTRFGPVAESTLISKIRNSEVGPEHLVWNNQMSSWDIVADIAILSVAIPETTQPPNLPSPLSVNATPAFQKLPSVLQNVTSETWCWILRGSFALVVLSVFMPWISVSGRASMDYGEFANQLQMSGFGIPNPGSGNVQFMYSYQGIYILWAVFGMLLAIAGLVITFVPLPKLTTYSRTALITVSIGCVVFVLFGGLAYGSGYSISSSNGFGSSGKVVLSASIGFYVAMIAALVASAIALAIPLNFTRTTRSLENQ